MDNGRLQALLDRVAGYEALRRDRKLEIVEWFCLVDPFLHVIEGTAPHAYEREQQAEFETALETFFTGEAAGLTPEQLQVRLDRVAHAHVEKWDADALERSRARGIRAGAAA